MKNLTVIVLSGFFLAGIFATAQESKQPVVGSPFQEEALPDNIAATVNGKPIPRDVFYQSLVRRYGGAVLVDLATMELIEQAAEKRGVKVSNKEVEQTIMDQENQAGGRAAFLQNIRSQGYSEEDYRRVLRTHLLLRKIV